jgi:hypothetical protein
VEEGHARFTPLSPLLEPDYFSKMCERSLTDTAHSGFSFTYSAPGYSMRKGLAIGQFYTIPHANSPSTLHRKT